MPFKNPKDKLAYMAKYGSTPTEMERRAARHRARYAMEKKHGKEALKGKDVDHVDNNPLNNSRRNLKAVPRGLNRSKKI